jgi:hypothetical protein
MFSQKAYLALKQKKKPHKNFPMIFIDFLNITQFPF